MGLFSKKSLSDEEARIIAEPVIKNVVNLISEKEYDKVNTILGGDIVSSLEEIIEDFLESNELSGIDKYDVDCSFHPSYEYHQLNIILYDDNSGFHADYDLTTDSELNDLTLQFKFVIKNRKIKNVILEDCSVM